jgi:hypothetical protein
MKSPGDALLQTEMQATLSHTCYFVFVTSG